MRALKVFLDIELMTFGSLKKKISTDRLFRSYKECYQCKLKIRMTPGWVSYIEKT